jgi:hypothetical protein
LPAVLALISSWNRSQAEAQTPPVANW